MIIDPKVLDSIREREERERLDTLRQQAKKRPHLRLVVDNARRSSP